MKKHLNLLLLLVMPFISGNALADEPELPLPPAPANQTPAVSTEEAAPTAPAEAAEEASEEVPAAQEKLQKLEVVAISGKTPYYVDNGSAMVPIRPICDFLGLQINYRSGIVSVSGVLPSAAPASDAPAGGADEAKVKPAGNPIFVNFREGSKVAQIIEGTHNRTFNLDIAPETRLGVSFVPLRFVAAAFDSKVTYNAKNALITVQSGNRIGYLRQPDQCGANVKKTVQLTVANRVGRAFTLQLKGPCNFRIELGRLQKVSVKLPAGLYEYTAVSSGVYPKHGKRWLRSGAQVNWTFGG